MLNSNASHSNVLVRQLNNVVAIYSLINLNSYICILSVKLTFFKDAFFRMVELHDNANVNQVNTGQSLWPKMSVSTLKKSCHALKTSPHWFESWWILMPQFGRVSMTVGISSRPIPKSSVIIYKPFIYTKANIVTHQGWHHLIKAIINSHAIDYQCYFPPHDSIIQNNLIMRREIT